MSSLPLPAEGPSDQADKNLLERALGVLSDVRAGEGLTALLFTLDVFLLLTAYYLLKTVREPLILAGGGAEVKSYASAGQALLLVGVVRGVSTLSKRFGRVRIVTITSIFFASNLAVFFLLGRLGVPLGVPFYLWVGCFNVTAIAQFWSFANDVYTPEQGKRLFAVVALGSSLGAVFGADVARRLFVPLGPYRLMLVAAALLLVCLAILRVVGAREARRGPARAHDADAPPGGTDGFTLIARDRYLFVIAAMVLVYNSVNSLGEYVLDRTLLDAARQQVAEGTAGGKSVQQIVGVWKGGYFFWVNTVGVVLQLFVVSRVLKHLGLRAALFVLPIIAFAGALTMATAPVLMFLRAAKIAENGVDYSLQNTARQALFLPVSREAKYNAKAAIDTVMMRVGDTLTGLGVWVGSRCALGVRGFAMVDLALIAVWFVLAWAIGQGFQLRAPRAVPAVAA